MYVGFEGFTQLANGIVMAARSARDKTFFDRLCNRFILVHRFPLEPSHLPGEYDYLGGQFRPSFRHFAQFPRGAIVARLGNL